MDNPYQASNSDADAVDVAGGRSLASGLPWILMVVALLVLFAVVMVLGVLYNVYAYVSRGADDALLGFSLYMQRVYLVQAIRNAGNALLILYTIYCVWRYRNALKVFCREGGDEGQLVAGHHNVWRAAVICLGGLACLTVATGVLIGVLRMQEYQR